MPEMFTASTQYNDWKGEAAADDQFTNSIREFLRNEGIMKTDDFLIGLDYYIGEDKFFSLTAYFVTAHDYEAANEILAQNETLKVKKAEVELNPDQFFRLFKRFNIALSWKDMDLIGRETTAI